MRVNSSSSLPETYIMYVNCVLVYFIPTYCVGPYIGCAPFNNNIKYVFSVCYDIYANMALYLLINR